MSSQGNVKVASYNTTLTLMNELLIIKCFVWYVVMKTLRKKFLLTSFGFFVLTLPYVLLHVYVTPTANIFPPRESFVKRFRFNGSFVSALTALADADRCIVLAMVDKGFTDVAINFHEASLRTHHVDNFLFVGVGRKACEVLTNLSIPCFYYADDPNADQASSFGQVDFNRKMNIRTDMILEALAADFTVIHLSLIHI